MLQRAQRDLRKFKGKRLCCHLDQPRVFFCFFFEVGSGELACPSILFHSGCSSVLSCSVERPRCPAGPPASEGGAARGGDLHPVRYKKCFTCLTKVFLLDFPIVTGAAKNFLYFYPSHPPPFPPSCLTGKGIKGPPKEKKKTLHLCEAPF